MDGSLNGAEGIVLVHVRYAEDGHHGVTDELLDRSAMAPDWRAHRLVPTAEDVPKPLGVEPFAQPRRFHEVAEEDRDRLASGGRAGHPDSVPLGLRRRKGV